MAPTPRNINILITGFGPFMAIETNPSWLAVKPLHNTQLDLDSPPCLSATSAADGVNGGGGRVRIQTIQIPVHYGSVLDVVPRIHGGEPVSSQAGFWLDERLDAQFGGSKGKSYPEAYPIQHPENGWDVVIHVGVGKSGGVRCETEAHKVGYGKPDAKGCYAPVLHVACDGLEGIEERCLDKQGEARGFGEGYEGFGCEEQTSMDVRALVAWLKERGMGEGEVEQSMDPGRYVCDFVYYCSLCEAKRRGEVGRRVLFVHVPPKGKDLEVERCTDAIRAVAWYMASKSARASTA